MNRQQRHRLECYTRLFESVKPPDFKHQGWSSPGFEFWRGKSFVSHWNDTNLAKHVLCIESSQGQVMVWNDSAILTSNVIGKMAVATRRDDPFFRDARWQVADLESGVLLDFSAKVAAFYEAERRMAEIFDGKVGAFRTPHVWSLFAQSIRADFKALSSAS